MKCSLNVAAAMFILLAGLNLPCSASSIAKEKISRRDSIPRSAPLRGTHWNLTEIAGRKIPDSLTNKQMYILLKVGSNQVAGNGACNAFTGSYKLGDGKRIIFSQMISTRVMCPTIKYEDEFMKALTASDHYDVSSDTLNLKHGDDVIVATFVAKKK